MRIPHPAILLATLLLTGAGLLSCAHDEGSNNDSVILSPPGETFLDPARATTQVDRVGKPGVALMLIAPNVVDLFNAGAPLDDFRFREQMLPILQSLGQGNTNPETLSQTFLPDVLVIDTRYVANFSNLNGRTLSDDAMDTILRAVTGNSASGDHVDANDSAFSTTFPYLARPN